MDTPREGPSETVKGGFHLMAFGLCSILFAHNVGMWLTNRNKENGINTIVYGAGVLFEASRTLRHLRRTE